MAQTAAQKAAAAKQKAADKKQLAQAQAQLALAKTALKSAEALKVKLATAQIEADKNLAQAKLDQIEAQANKTLAFENAAALAKTYGGTFDAVTGKITLKKDTFGNVVLPQDDPVYVALKKTLEQYDITGIAGTIDKIRSDYPDIASEDLLTLLRTDSRYNTEYNKRFAGNAALVAKGMPALDEKTYFANELAYGKMFNAYDLGRFANTGQYATLIGNAIAPDEAGKRVSLAYDRVLKAEGTTLEAYQKFYPSLTTSDLVAAMLSPKEQLPALERKVTAAEIGGAALRQGLQAFQAATDVKSARYSNVMGGTVGAGTLETAGVTGAGATAKYETIAGELPTMEKLSAISGTTAEQYAQKEAEQEQLLGLASAKRKKDVLLAQEAARYAGSSGTLGASYGTARSSFGTGDYSY